MIGKVHAYGYATLPFYYDPPPLSARITHVVTSHAETAEKARQLVRPTWPPPISVGYRKSGRRYRSRLHAQQPAL